MATQKRGRRLIDYLCAHRCRRCDAKCVHRRRFAAIILAARPHAVIQRRLDCFPPFARRFLPAYRFAGQLPRFTLRLCEHHLPMVFIPAPR